MASDACRYLGTAVEDLQGVRGVRERVCGETKEKGLTFSNTLRVILPFTIACNVISHPYPTLYLLLQYITFIKELQCGEKFKSSIILV